jgi:heterodisulfide reductase subunit C
MPIVERSLVEVDRTETLVLDGVDVSGDWNTFLRSRVSSDLDVKIADWVRAQPGGENRKRVARHRRTLRHRRIDRSR